MSVREILGVRCFEWKSNYLNCGHVSLELSDGTYISFWQMSPCRKILSTIGINIKQPTTYCILLMIDWLLSFIFPFENKTSTESYRQDVRMIGREADRKITFHGDFLDEYRVKDWWNNHRNEPYGLITRNCSTMVFNALDIGGSTQFVKKTNIRFWTTAKLYDYCEKLQWKTYRQKADSNERVRTDFEPVVEKLKAEAGKIRKRKEKQEEMKNKGKAKEKFDKKESGKGDENDENTNIERREDTYENHDHDETDFKELAVYEPDAVEHSTHAPKKSNKRRRKNQK